MLRLKDQAICQKPQFWLATALFIYAGVFIVALGIDLIFNYKMCELCMTQRLIIATSILLASWGFSRPDRQAQWYFLLVTLVAAFGLWLGFWHLSLLKQQLSTSVCMLVVNPVILPKKLFHLLQSFYTFMPCSSSTQTFFGLTFPAWSIGLHGVVLSYAGFGWACVLGLQQQ